MSLSFQGIRKVTTVLAYQNNFTNPTITTPLSVTQLSPVILALKLWPKMNKELGLNYFDLVQY